MSKYSFILVLSLFLNIKSVPQYSTKENVLLVLFENSLQLRDQKIRKLEETNLKLYILKRFLKKDNNNNLNTNLCTVSQHINSNNEKIKKIKIFLKNKVKDFINENLWLAQEDINDLRHRYYDTSWLISKI